MNFFKIKFLWIICLVFCFIFYDSFIQERKANADDIPKILIINTNSSINKYLISQKAFEKKLPYPSLSIYLNDNKWQISDVKKLLRKEKPDLIYCIGTKAYMVANQYADHTNIVFSSIINWLRLPITSKTYGVSNELSPETQILMFRYVLPDIKKIIILYSKEFNAQWFEQTVKAGEKIGVNIIGIQACVQNYSLGLFKKKLPDADAFWLISDPFILRDKKSIMKIFKICNFYKKPVLSYHQVFAKYGASLVVGPDAPTIGRQAANLAVDILNKSNISKKVQFPVGTNIILNLKKVKEYQLNYSKDVLGTINEIIE